jgi:exodeoxyribonuclease VII small subunit
MAKKMTVQSVPQSFELAIAELESILGAMEGDQIGLEESLVKYERGTFLLQWCRGVLAEAEKKIQIISQNAGGQLVAEPLQRQDDQE